MLPLISRLKHEHGNTADQHHQLYTHGEGRQLAGGGGALTRANTVPIRLKLDFHSLYETHAPKYSACFAAGAWFRRPMADTSTS